MPITFNTGGFTKADLETNIGAEAWARKEDDTFEVSLEKNFRDGWYFDAEACREAAEFFTALAEELDRQEGANLHRRTNLP